MEIRQLKYFYQICEDMSFSKASNKLFITQQALSQSIKNMENELGVPLFIRNNHGIRLTETAAFIKPDIQKFLSDYDGLLQKIQDSAHSTKGALKLALPPGVLICLMPILLIFFKKDFPDIDLEIVERRDFICEKLLLNEAVDLACSVHPVSNENFKYTPLIKRKVFAYINKDNPLAQKASVKFSDCARETFLLVDQNYKWHHSIIQRCRDCGFEPNIYHCSSQVDVLANLVTYNVGITFFEARLAPHFENKNTVLVPIDESENFYFEAGFITNKKHPTKYIANLLIDYVIKHYSDEDACSNNHI